MHKSLQNILDRYEPKAPQCPACYGDRAESLGKLGNVEHYRCKNCGMTFDSTTPVGDT